MLLFAVSTESIKIIEKLNTFTCPGHFKAGIRSQLKKGFKKLESTLTELGKNECVFFLVVLVTVITARRERGKKLKGQEDRHVFNSPDVTCFL